MSNLIKGEALLLYVYDGAAYRPIACLTSNSLSQTRSVIEAQTKCEPGVTEKSAGAMAYSLACEGLYIDTTSASGETDKASHDFLKGLMDSGATFFWKMDTGLADTPNYFGDALLTALDLTMPSGDEFANFTGTLDGSGAIVDTDPVP
jgi:hypothetical protein